MRLSKCSLTISASIVLFGFACLMPTATAQPAYRLADLHQPTNPYPALFRSTAFGINISGQVIGSRQVASSFAWGTVHAFRTLAPRPSNNASVFTIIATPQDDLGTLGGESSIAFAINSSGQVVGLSTLSRDDVAHGFRTAANSPINPATDDLGTLGGSDCSGCFPKLLSVARGINSAGQVVGYSPIPTTDAIHAFRTVANSPINPATDDLGTLGGSSSDSSAATGINDSGQVVGSSSLSGDALPSVAHAFRTATNSPINPATDDLGTLGGTFSFAEAINSAGQVAGWSWISGDTVMHAFRTAANSPINPATDDLGTFGGPVTEAFGINDSGQAVGFSSYPGDVNAHAFLYTGGVMYDLHKLFLEASGWSESIATAINNAGQIVGYGVKNNQYQAFLLNPFGGQ